MFIPIHRKSNHINVNLTTTDTDIQNLIDEILAEITVIKKISNRSRAREALKKVILNFIHAERTKDCVRISRNKNDYGHHRMYLGFRSLKMCVFRFSPFIVIDCSTINSA